MITGVLLDALEKAYRKKKEAEEEGNEEIATSWGDEIKFLEDEMTPKEIEHFKKSLKASKVPKRKPLLFKVINKQSRLNTRNLGNYVLSKIDYLIIDDDTGRKPHIYYYNKGYYELGGRKKIIKFIRELLGESVSIHYINEIFAYLEVENLIHRDDIKTSTHLINLNNGVYNIKTKKLIAHNPRYRFLYKIPWNYNPDAKCPKIMEYFDTTLQEKFTKFSQKLFGYSLYYDYPIAAVFYLYGLGGNGKKVFIDLLIGMLGKQNISTKDIKSILSNRFTLASLYGKLANISGELSSSVLNNTDTLKNLSAGDIIQAEFKGKDGFDFSNKAKVITACNEIPYCKDKTRGWEDRQYVIPFLQTFRGRRAETLNLGKKLTSNKKEMEGLLLWALEGLHQTLKDESFKYPGDHIDTYYNCRNGIEIFLKGYVKKTNEFSDVMPFKKIYAKYEEWCNIHDAPIKKPSAVAYKLTALCFPIDTINEEKVRRYCKLKSKTDLHFTNDF